MTRLEQKIKNFYTKTMEALWHYYKHDDPETAFHCFRYSGEAFMKAIIFKIYGDQDGNDIILGKKNAARQDIQSIGYNLSFSELHDFLVNQKNIEDDILEGLNKINTAANKYGGSHDPNKTICFDRQKSEFDNILLISERISHKLYDFCQFDYPIEMKRAYQEHIINDDLMNSIQNSDVSELISDLDNFNQQNHYILISPKTFENVKREQLRMLNRVSWSFVIDFNPLSKEKGGLYEAFMPEIENNCVPLTIQDKDKPNVGNGTSGNTNWFFANGLKSMKTTLVSSVDNWIYMRYHKFIKKLFQIFCHHSLKRIYVVCLFDDFDYVDEIVRCFEDIDEIERDLLSFVFISTNGHFLNKIDAFKNMDLDVRALI